MIELCDTCGAVQSPGGGGCSCGGAAASAPLALDLDIDRNRPPPRSMPAPSVAPSMAPMPGPLPLPMPPPAMRNPLPPPPVSIGPSSSMVKLAIIALIAAAFIAGLVVFVGKLKTWTSSAVDGNVMRPYPAPNRLVIASVTSDYGSEALDDGSILLRKLPAGPAAGLAGYYGANPSRVDGALDRALANLKDGTYRALEAPTEPCRSDAETSRITLGEITFGTGKVTLWTCTLTKKNNVYFLAYAAPASATDDDTYRAVHILKSSQLVSHDLCAMNVINGGCSPDAAALLVAAVKHARK